MSYQSHASNLSALELDIAIVEPGTTETETQFGPKLDIKFIQKQRITERSSFLRFPSGKVVLVLRCLKNI